MIESVMLGLGQSIIKIPRSLWEIEVGVEALVLKSKSAFMTTEHHRVRNFLVRELPRVGTPIAPETITEKLSMPTARVVEVLDEMEKNLFFLVRNEHGAVTWIYPVTVESTPHKLSFNSGEKIFGACGVDVMATPFVYGRLHRQSLTVTVNTESALSARPIQFTLSNELNYELSEPDHAPLVFQPYVNWLTFDQPNIIKEF